MFEVSGGFSKSALTLLKKAADMADKNKVRLKTGEWSWSAMDFSSYFMQLLSFEINKLSAMAVLNGVRAAAAAATVLAVCEQTFTRVCVLTLGGCQVLE